MEKQLEQIALSTPTGDATSERWRLLGELFAFLDREMVEYCVVGDHGKMQSGRDGDVDIVVATDILRSMPRLLLRFSVTADARLMQSIRHETTAYFFVLAWRDSAGKLNLIQLDICSDYYRFGRKLLSAHEILNGRHYVTTTDSTDYYVAPPEMAFVYYALKKIEKNSLEDHHGDMLSRLFSRSPNRIPTLLSRFWKAEEVGVICRAAASNDWRDVRPLLTSLKASLHSRIRRSLGARFSEIRRKVGRIIRPTGFFIAVFGPDGSGKSTVNDHIRSSLELAFWGNEYMHLRPRLGFGGGGNDATPVVDPHAMPPRGYIGSTLKVFYYVVDYLLGYYLTVKPLLIRSRLVVFDRYFHDIIVDPRRYRYGGSTLLPMLCARLVPKPDLFLFLDAPAEIIQSRKTEVSFRETARQREAYQELARKLRSFRIIDASGDLETTLAEVEWVIVDRMADRLERRFWLR